MGFTSAEYFLNFFSSLYIPPWLQKNYGVNSVKITGKCICESKNWSVHFCLCLEANLSPRLLSLPPREKEIIHSFWTSIFLKSIFPQQKGEERRIMEWKKWPKLNLQGYWSQVLINCTIFAAFTLLFLFCYAII